MNRSFLIVRRTCTQNVWLTLLLSTAVACGPFVLEPSRQHRTDGLKSLPTSPPETEGRACQGGEQWFALKPASHVDWEVMKTGGDAVKGKLDVKTDLRVNNSSFEGMSFTLAFNAANLATGIDLRDQRIGDLIFGLGTRETLGFNVTRVRGVDGNHKLPAVGQSRDFILEGRIELANQTRPMNVEVTITSLTRDEITITPKTGQLTVLMYAQLGLSKRVAALLELCRTALVDERVTVSFTLQAHNVCRDARASSSKTTPTPQ